MKPAALRILGLLLAGLAAVWAIDCAGRDEGSDRARTQAHERNMAIVAQAYRGSRDRTDTVVVTVVKQGARVDTAVADTRAAIDTARAILADSANSKNPAITALGELTVRAERLVAEVVVYRAQVDSLTIRLAEERAAAQASLDAKDAVIRSLKAERCTIAFGIRCPTRTQAAIAGSILTLAAVVALR